MMKKLLKLVLLSVVVLLTSTQPIPRYDVLPEGVRKHINTAIIRANQQFRDLNQHINFHSLDGKPAISTNYHVKMTLGTTKCPVANSESEYKQRQDCEFNNARWIYCVVCKNKEGGEHVDCAFLRDKEKKTKMMAACNGVYYHGGGTIMSQSSGHGEEEFGCVGCI